MATVWAKRQGETWAALGETTGLIFDVDSWGSRSADFRVDEGRDVLKKHDEVYLETAAAKAWSGRVVTANHPAYACEGDQYELDDDLYDTFYVHSKLTDWKDPRSFPTTDLALWKESTRVEVGNGGIVFGWAQGTSYELNQRAGVTLDLGQNSTAKRVVFDLEGVNAANSVFTMVIRGHNLENPEAVATFEDPYAVGMDTFANGIKSATFATPRRYVTLFFYIDTGPGGSTGFDHLIRILSALVVRESAYEASDISTLRISDVVKDVRDYATTKLSRSDEKIEQTSVVLPHFITEGPATGRQTIERAAAIQGLQPKIDVDKRMVLKATAPSVPAFRATNRAKFEPASRGGGEEGTVNRVIVSFTDASGGAQQLVRMTAELPGRALQRLSTPDALNPGFEVDVANWTVVGAGLQLVRSTVVFDTGIASGRADRIPAQSTAAGSYVEGAIGGTHEVGQIYVAEARLRWNTDFTSVPQHYVWRLTYGYREGGRLVDGGVATFIHPGPAQTWATAKVAWAPHLQRTANVYLRLEMLPSTEAPLRTGLYPTSYVDSVAIYRSQATALDQAGIVRTARVDFQSAPGLDVASAVADFHLDTHSGEQVAGTLDVPAGGVQRLPSGEDVDPSLLGLGVGELILLTDPATGVEGRLGRIGSVFFNEEAETATVEIYERTEGLKPLLVPA